MGRAAARVRELQAAAAGSSHFTAKAFLASPLKGHQLRSSPYLDADGLHFEQTKRASGSLLNRLGNPSIVDPPDCSLSGRHQVWGRNMLYTAALSAFDVRRPTQKSHVTQLRSVD